MVAATSDPKSFIWKAADQIIEKVSRGRGTLRQIKSQMEPLEQRRVAQPQCSTARMGRERDEQARMVGGTAQVDPLGVADDEFGCRHYELHAAVINERGSGRQARRHVRAVAGSEVQTRIRA